MDKLRLRKFIEALLFTAMDPVSASRLSEVLEGETTTREIREAISDLRRIYEEEGHAIAVVEIAGGFQMCTRPEYGPAIKRFHKIEIREKLSKPALETLAFIAIKQPVVRTEIEEVRRVDSGHVLRTLLEKGLIKITGRKKAPGNPLVYTTTDNFLSHFGLASLDDLPSEKELEESHEPEPVEKTD